MKTPMSSDTKLMKDEECQSVDSTKYRGMIGSLLYLTTSRPDIMYSVCLYARFQEDPKTSHLEVDGIYQTSPPSPNDIKSLVQIARKKPIIRIHHNKVIDIEENNILNHEIQSYMKSWVEIIRENVFCLVGNRYPVPTCLCHMVYCIATLTKYNLAFFILKQMKAIRQHHKVNLLYGMLLNRLSNHIVLNFPELLNDRYILYDRVMYQLAPHYERKTRTDHGTKKCRHLNSTSSSSAFVHSSSSHHIDDNEDDENEEEISLSNTPSTSRFVISLLNVVPQVFKNPPLENQNIQTYQNEILNHQSKHRDEHQNGLRSIGRALKNVLKGRKK
ncbi:hypothetical protein Tco_0481847 [Tanacetum coccineum]